MKHTVEDIEYSLNTMFQQIAFEVTTVNDIDFLFNNIKREFIVKKLAELIVKEGF